MSRVLPILFNTDMVRAILRKLNPKTATRRCIKGFIPDDAIWGYTAFTPKGYISCRGTFADGYGEKFFRLPCQPGDILYARETWWLEEFYEDEALIRYKAGGELGIDYGRDIFQKLCKHARGGNWRPSIHMPKEAARIWLKVTDVRVARLQDITEEQAVKEGISRLYDDLSDAEYIDWAKRTGIYPKAKEDWGYKNYLWHGNFGKCGTGNWKSDNWDYQYSSYDNAIGSFSSLWNATLKKSDLDRYGWEANPWVWVIEFERCEKPEPCILVGMEPAEDKRPCIGYGRSDDDEPCEMCKGCKQCSGNDELERCEKPENI